MENKNFDNQNEGLEIPDINLDLKKEPTKVPPRNFNSNS